MGWDKLWVLATAQKIVQASNPVLEHIKAKNAMLHFVLEVCLVWSQCIDNISYLLAQGSPQTQSLLKDASI